MTSPEEFSTALQAAERELAAAATAEDVRRVWRRHYLLLGHRALGRLLVGQSAERQLLKRSERKSEQSRR